MAFESHLLRAVLSADAAEIVSSMTKPEGDGEGGTNIEAIAVLSIVYSTNCALRI